MAVPAPVYEGTSTVGYGMLATGESTNRPQSYIAENANFFGRAAVEGTNSITQRKKPSAGTDQFAGVWAYAVDASDLDTEAYAQYDSAGVWEKDGVIWVYVEETVAAGSAVRMRHTVSGALVAGSFAVTAEAGKTSLLSGVEWANARTGAGMVKLKILGGGFVTVAD